MYFNQFRKKLSGEKITEQLRCYDHLIQKDEDGTVFIGTVKTKFTELEEARNYIKQQYETVKLEEQVKTEIYEELSENKIADIIQKYYDVKVTDTLIESYIDLASSKLFTLDPAVEDIRKLNKLDTLVEGKIDYRLEDNSVIAISQHTNEKLKDLFQAHTDVVEHMRQTKENFIKVLKDIGE
jgi:hypothetical protein